MKSSFAVIFDMDGVLIDSNPYHKISLKQFCAKYGHNLTDKQLEEKIYGRTNKDWIPNVFGPLPAEQIAHYTDEKEALFREIYNDHVAPLKGLVPFLTILKKNNIPMAIGTSAPGANVDFTLNKTGIGSFFDAILDDTFVNKGKPDPEIYIKAAHALGYDPQKCIVFEDSISGVLAGHNARCKVVGVTTTHTANELALTDLIIEDFEGISLQNLENLFIS
ncbi:MAG TPA: HAD family phosphatase [Cyclobacteriaceae bacterium]|jgi:HAD superfamily hydrolase (TIGR01509 family)|nr:HAD family phosphatase [Cyclobacteriaceae bacterium]